MSSILTINGFDFEPYLAYDGIKYKRNDVESEDAGRVASGIARRDRIIIIPEMTITLKNIDFGDENGHLILQAIEPQWLDVTYYDLRLGKEVTRQFYTNNVTHTLRIAENGKKYWRIDPFPLIAQGVAGDGRGKLE